MANTADILVGYNLDTVTTQCFMAMLENPAWFNLAQSNSSGGSAQAILASLATLAVTAAQALEAQLKLNISL